MDEKTPTVTHLPEQHRFTIALEGEPAYLEYALGKDSSFMVMHTEVPPSHSGKGYASRLAGAAMAYVEEQNLRVLPLCTYMATYLKRHRQQWEHLFAPNFAPAKD